MFCATNRNLAKNRLKLKLFQQNNVKISERYFKKIVRTDLLREIIARIFFISCMLHFAKIKHLEKYNDVHKMNTVTGNGSIYKQKILQQNNNAQNAK